MNWRTAVVVLIGVAVVALGSLWLLQGADAVHVRPVLCATNCTPVTGGSPGWLAAGLVTVLIGVGVVFIATKHIHHAAK